MVGIGYTCRFGLGPYTITGLRWTLGSSTVSWSLPHDNRSVVGFGYTCRFGVGSYTITGLWWTLGTLTVVGSFHTRSLVYGGLWIPLPFRGLSHTITGPWRTLGTPVVLGSLSHDWSMVDFGPTHRFGIDPYTRTGTGLNSSDETFGVLF